jgi:histidyl-tRNA synthetase
MVPSASVLLGSDAAQAQIRPQTSRNPPPACCIYAQVSVMTRSDWTLGIPDERIELHLNTIGCPQCHPAYRDAVQAFGRAHLSSLCPACRERIERNPLRLLDCKVPTCQAIMAQAQLLTPICVKAVVSTSKGC